jgi:hypothetical protein
MSYNQNQKQGNSYKGPRREPTTELVTYMLPGKFEGTKFYGGPFSVRYNSEKDYHSLRVKMEYMDLTIREIIEKMAEEKAAYKQQAEQSDQGQGRGGRSNDRAPFDGGKDVRTTAKPKPQGNSNW